MNFIEADELGSTLFRVAAILLILLVFVRSAPAHAMGGLFDTSKGHHHHHHHHHHQNSGGNDVGPGGNQTSIGHPTEPCSGDCSNGTGTQTGGNTGTQTGGPIGDPLSDVQIPVTQTELPLPSTGGGGSLTDLDPPHPSDATGDPSPVPLPGTLSLFGAGLCVIALLVWLRRRHRTPARPLTQTRKAA
jgi:hypothetical protein